MIRNATLVSPVCLIAFQAQCRIDRADKDTQIAYRQVVTSKALSVPAGIVI